MNIQMPLRYQISNWKQLSRCKSNNSRELSIHVTEFVQNFMVSGLRITVDHTNLGTLFAYVIDARGDLISNSSDSIIPFELSPDEILKELEKFGFLVTYNPRSLLKGNQIEYLMTLQNLHFDKLRVLTVKHIARDVIANTKHIVAFNVKDNPNWINNSYVASNEEYIKSLQDGSAIDITNVSETQRYDWSWLDYVGNISDILDDNSEVGSEC